LFEIWRVQKPPYLATISASYPLDLSEKVYRASKFTGPKLFIALSPCPPGWDFDPAIGVEIGRLAVKTGVWPLKQYLDGKVTHTHVPHPRLPVEEYLKLQGRFRHLFEPVRDDLQAVEREFARQVQSQVHVIPEIGNYLLKSGGKRVRPAVLLMSARLCGYTGPRAILNAAVVEFIHTATLVHDDIIDDADVRRGRKAVHSQWGSDVTVLAGDFLYIKSMAMALTQDSLDIVRLLCDVTLRMIEGELYQLTKNGVVDLTEDEHFDIIRRKTAHLFGGCAQIGGMLGEVGPEKEQALREYGFSLGIMFQLVDDLLDFTGAAEVLGKPVGADLREGKVTLPLIHLLEHGGPEAGELIRGVVRDRDVTADDWARIKTLLAEYRSIDYAYARAVEFGEAAKRQLRVFAPNPEREALMALADYVLLRDR